MSELDGNVVPARYTRSSSRKTAQRRNRGAVHNQPDTETLSAEDSDPFTEPDQLLDDRTPRQARTRRSRLLASSPTKPTQSLYATSLQSSSSLPPSLSAAPTLSSASSTGESALGDGGASPRQRNTSPVKSVSSLQLTSQPIEFLPLDGPEADLEAALGADGFALFEELFVVQSGRGTIPRGLEGELRGMLGGRARALEHCYIEAAPGKDIEESQNREFEEIRRIARMSNRCKTEQDCEPQWNCVVHSPLLQLAVQGCEGVDVRNISTARILPAYLPSLQSKRVEGKLVDFAFHLEPSPPLLTAIRSFLSNEFKSPPASEPQPLTINHTPFGPTALRPLAVSVETKMSGSGEGKAMVQLALWAYAHVQRLRRVAAKRGKNTGSWRVPAMPLLHVAGAQWNVYFAVAREKEGGLWVFGGLLLGETSSVHGCYQVLAGLRALVRWAGEKYMSWVEELLM